VFDTQVAAGFVGDGYPIRLQELVRRHLGHHLPKTETLSDWSQRPLSDDQLRYAADDVLLLEPLAEALERRLEEAQNTHLAAACTQELVERALQPEDPRGLWRAVPGSHLLDDVERAVLAELAAWRELAARERDVPRNAVASDAVLLDLARRQPQTLDVLRGNRRLPAQVWRRDGAAVLACVARGRQTAPPAAVVRPRPWLDLVWAAARACGRTRGIAAELVLGESVLDALAQQPELPGWRSDALGLLFTSFLRGECGIDVVGGFSFSRK
jgi:ribonuclease D